MRLSGHAAVLGEAKTAIERLETTLEGFDEEVKDRYYRRNFEDMVPAL